MSIFEVILKTGIRLELKLTFRASKRRFLFVSLMLSLEMEIEQYLGGPLVTAL